MLASWGRKAKETLWVWSKVEKWKQKRIKVKSNPSLPHEAANGLENFQPGPGPPHPKEGGSQAPPQAGWQIAAKKILEKCVHLCSWWRPREQSSSKGHFLWENRVWSPQNCLRFGSKGLCNLETAGGKGSWWRTRVKRRSRGRGWAIYLPWGDFPSASPGRAAPDRRVQGDTPLAWTLRETTGADD